MSLCLLPLPEPNYVIVDGAAIATRVLEPTHPAAGDVVLCHGTPWSSQIWGRVARELSSEYRVFLWDMPGYGQSTMDSTVRVDLRSQSIRLAGLLAHWDLHSPHVVAHDIGGAVALGAHLLQGIEYADLFLWDVVVLDPWGSPFFRLVADNAPVFTELPPTLHAALVKEYIAGAVRHNLSDLDIDTLARPWLDVAGQGAFYRQIAALSTVDTHQITERLSAVRCPVRIGWGSQDPWIPVDQAYNLQTELPGHSSVIEIEGVAHLAPVEKPAAVSAVLREWHAETRHGRSEPS